MLLPSWYKPPFYNSVEEAIACGNVIRRMDGRFAVMSEATYIKILEHMVKTSTNPFGLDLKWSYYN